MIYINLLPVREIKRLNKAKNQIYLVGGLLAGLVLLLLLLLYYQVSNVNALKAEQASIETEKQNYAKILNNIKKLEAERKILLTRIEVIKQLKKSSSLTVHILDEVANLTPSNRMWLKNLSQSGNQLSLAGMALDNRTIAKYLDDLEGSPYINDVRLVTTALEKFADRDLKNFSIACMVSIPEAEKKDNPQK